MHTFAIQYYAYFHLHTWTEHNRSGHYEQVVARIEHVSTKGVGKSLDDYRWFCDVCVSIM
jgi:hypothetical protein